MSFVPASEGVNRSQITVTPTGAGNSATIIAEVVNGICYLYCRHIQFKSAASAWQDICTLPEGYRPKNNIDNSMSGNGAYGAVTIGTSGTIAIISQTKDVNMFSSMSYPVA